ncbi:MAG: aminopeptidase P family protein [Lachnospiraceae bacterium]|nr:aminopeptidase P family protein [Lachnospiraceae bacterium]
MIKDRLEKMRLLMKREKIDLYYIPTGDFHQSEYVGEYFKERNYMSGFTGSAGSMVVTKEEACLFTDGRYHIQAEGELQGSGIHLFKCGEANVPTEEQYAEVYMRTHEKIGFDGRTVSTAFVERFLENTGLSEHAVVYDKDLVNDLWANRPEISQEEIYVLEPWQTGETTKEKLKRIRESMKKSGTETHILTSLDDIAWIYNLRGNDVKNNPVFLAYSVITQENAYLYLMEQAVTKEVEKYLQTSGVEWRNYEKVYQDIPALCGKNTILLDKESTNYTLFKTIPDQCRIVNQINPSTIMKAVKNKTEIENTKKAHIKDGLAVTRFIHYIKENADKEITEFEAAQYIDNLRKNTEGCFDLSFETISAYGANGAMMHYSAREEGCAKIQSKGFLLVDSGGQYREGTTDVTRTIALGELSREMKKHYTLVLCGMLRLMNARFLYGCTGRNLDILARGPLWEQGIDYRCGTGHGVGHILNVHEGPNVIRWLNRTGARECVLEEGMVTTDEPGVYLENQYGIRIENELLCVKDIKNQWGQFMKFECLTFVPIELDAVDVAYMEKKDVELLNQYQNLVYEKLSPYMTEEEKKWLKEYTKEIKF